PADGSGVDEGTTVTLTATASDAEDGDLTPAIAWASDLQGALGTGGTVSVPPTAAGTHHITAPAADRGGQTRPAPATPHVHAPPRVTITQPLDGTSAPAGTPLTFQATAIDGIDGNVTARISWVSDLNGPIGTGGSIATSTLARGTHVITAQVADSSGLTGSA